MDHGSLSLAEMQARLGELLSEHDERINQALLLRGQALELERLILMLQRSGNGTRPRCVVENTERGA